VRETRNRLAFACGCPGPFSALLGEAEASLTPVPNHPEAFIVADHTFPTVDICSQSFSQSLRDPKEGLRTLNTYGRCRRLTRDACLRLCSPKTAQQTLSSKKLLACPKPPECPESYGDFTDVSVS
jgi:hypothetical protein